MPQALAASIEDEKALLNSEAHAAPVRGHKKARAKQAARDVVREAVREVAKPAPAAARTVEERLAAIEATTDLAEMRSELKLNRWVLGAVAAALVGLIGMVFSSQNSTNVRLDQVQSEVNQRIDQTNVRIDQLQTETTAKIDSAVTDLRAEIRATNERLDARFDALMAEIRELRRDRARD